MDKLRSKLKQLFNEGLFHIFGSRVIAQVGGLISSMIVVRNLPKVEYGYYVGANNLYAYIAIFIGFGMFNVILQYCSERVSEFRKNAIYRFTLVSGMLANCILLAGILLLAHWKEASGAPEVAYYLRIMCLLPFVQYMDSYLQMVLRVKLQNKAFSYANMINAAVLLVGNVVFTIFLGIPGLIYSIYLAYFVTACVCAFFLHRENFFGGLLENTERLTGRDRREMSGYALTYAINNFSSTVLVLLDVTCLDLVLGDAAVLADYKVASSIPAACFFIPSCLMTFYYPKLVTAFSKDRQTGVRQLKELVKVSAIVNVGAYVCLAVFAPVIIWIVFGEKYMNVVGLFEILSINYLVYCVRNVTGNLIAVFKKVKVNLLFSVVSGILNIGLNLCLIPVLGSAGAAIATLLVTVVITVMNALYLWRFFKTELQ